MITHTKKAAHLLRGLFESECLGEITVVIQAQNLAVLNQYKADAGGRCADPDLRSFRSIVQSSQLYGPEQTIL